MGFAGLKPHIAERPMSAIVAGNGFLNWRKDRVRSALEGHNPTVLARMTESFAVIGDVQWLPGYCVALTSDPETGMLSDLPRPRRLRFLADTDLLAFAVESVCRDMYSGFRRVNIEILGNTDPFLHAHIWPRYDWEPAGIRDKPVWLYPPGHWRNPDHLLGDQHAPLRLRLTEEVRCLLEGL